jgi:hypothetical protein
VRKCDFSWEADAQIGGNSNEKLGYSSQGGGESVGCYVCTTISILYVYVLRETYRSDLEGRKFASACQAQ